MFFYLTFTYIPCFFYLAFTYSPCFLFNIHLYSMFFVYIHLSSCNLKKDRQYNGQTKKIDNTMAKRKRTKRQIMVGRILHRKLKVFEHELD